MSKIINKPRRGPLPKARTDVDLNSDVDVLQRHIGEVGESATTVDDLQGVGLVTQTSDGSYAADRKIISGPQGLYDYLDNFTKAQAPGVRATEDLNQLLRRVRR